MKGLWYEDQTWIVVPLLLIVVLLIIIIMNQIGLDKIIEIIKNVIG